MTYPSRADLSDGQKQCLRLVGQHLTSKEIARKLGISHFTVDQRLDSARRKLNAHSRKDAVRIFMAMERAGAGLCGGGQSGVFSIDVGPTVRTDIAIARTNLRLSADWRIRIAGDAAPASGPAMTLSTSF